MQKTVEVDAPDSNGAAANPIDDRMDWFTSIPYLFVHAFCLLGALPGLRPSWGVMALCMSMYFLRMFGITAGYHRYFAHRSYKTGRIFQFILAFIGTTSLQKGVLWWAAHHRAHHKYSDDPRDIHSPVQRGLYWAHQGWILCRRYNATDWNRIQDFAKFPELRWLNNHFIFPALAAEAVVFIGGFISGLPAFSQLLALSGAPLSEALWSAAREGLRVGLWGGFFSTVLLWHGTFTINSLAHVWGSRRYQTSDTSRNNLFLALITMGEGWHNNHHHYQSTANQGFFWWEVDFSYYILKMLSWFGIVWDLRKPPAHILANTIAKGDASGDEPAAETAATL